MRMKEALERCWEGSWRGGARGRKVEMRRGQGGSCRGAEVAWGGEDAVGHGGDNGEAGCNQPVILFGVVRQSLRTTPTHLQVDPHPWRQAGCIQLPTGHRAAPAQVAVLRTKGDDLWTVNGLPT